MPRARVRTKHDIAELGAPVLLEEAQAGTASCGAQHVDDCLSRARRQRQKACTDGRPSQKRLVLYEMENCPHSRQVREALSMRTSTQTYGRVPTGTAASLRAHLLGAKSRFRFFDPNTMP